MTIVIPGKIEAGKAGVEENHGGAAAVGAGRLGVTAAQVGAAGLRVSHIASREARVSPTEAIVEGPESTLMVETRKGCHHIASQHPRAGQIICPVATATGVRTSSMLKTNMVTVISGKRGVMRSMARMAGSTGCPRKGTAEEQSRWCTHLRNHGVGEDFVVDEEEERLGRQGSQ